MAECADVDKIGTLIKDSLSMGSIDANIMNNLVFSKFFNKASIMRRLYCFLL